MVPLAGPAKSVWRWLPSRFVIETRTGVPAAAFSTKVSPCTDMFQVVWVAFSTAEATELLLVALTLEDETTVTELEEALTELEETAAELELAAVELKTGGCGGSTLVPRHLTLSMYRVDDAPVVV